MLAQARPNKQGLHTMKYKSCIIGCCGGQLHKHSGKCMVGGHRLTRSQAFFDVKFCWW